MTATYTASVVYNTDIDKGSSNLFGTASVTGGGQSGRSITVSDGTSVVFTASPSAPTGFKFKGWYRNDSVSQQIVSYKLSVPMTVSGSDIVLVPVFEPDSPSFDRTIALNTSGLAESDAIDISSMSGYYHYALDATSSSTTYLFNGITANKLPDGRNITLRIHVPAGCGASVTVDGGTVSSSGTEQEQFSDEPVRGATPSPSTSQDMYVVYSIDNPSESTATQLTIDVDYYDATQYRTVSVHKDHGGQGLVKVYETDDPDPPYGQTSVTVLANTSVTATVVPAAGYDFDGWYEYTDQWTRLSQVTPFTFNATEDTDLWAVMTAQDPRISVKVSNAAASTAACGEVRAYVYSNAVRSGGTMHVLMPYTDDEGSFTKSAVTNYTNTVYLEAKPAAGYKFLYWKRIANNPSEQAEYIYSDKIHSMSVSSISADQTWIAYFELSPNGTVLVKAYTSVYDPSGTKFETMSGSPQTHFLLESEHASTDAYSEPVSAHFDIDGSGGQYSVTMDLIDNSPYHTLEGDGWYEYTFNEYLYLDRYFLENAVLDRTPTDWIQTTSPVTINLPNTTPYDPNSTTGGAGQQYNYNVTAVYNKTKKCKVITEIYTPSGDTTGISITGDLYCSEFDEITLNTIVSPSVPSGRFGFKSWRRDSESGTEVSANPLFTYQITSLDMQDGEIKFVAVYDENCFVNFSANPSNLGSVTGVITSTSSPLDPQGQWVPYGSQLTFTAAPAALQPVPEIIGWSCNGVDDPSTSSTYSCVANVTNTNVTAKFASSVWNLELNISDADAGSVTIEYADAEDASEWTVQSPTGTNDYRIPQGYWVRATAHPNTRYYLSSFTLYDSADAFVENSVHKVYKFEMTADLRLDAVFAYAPWITTLRPIMKVF